MIAVPHGSLSTYTNHGCRCAKCRDAHRRYMVQWKQRQYEARVLVNGVPIAPVPTERHGLASTYRNYGCRCGPCTDARSKRDSRLAGGST